MPSKSESAEITVDYVLAETIIVGAVPESYLNMSYPISGIY